MIITIVVISHKARLRTKTMQNPFRNMSIEAKVEGHGDGDSSIKYGGKSSQF